MRFAWRPEPRGPGDPIDRLVRRTRIRLATVTLLLIAFLLLGVGAVTAAVAIRAGDASVDRSLRDAASAAMATLVGTNDNENGGNDTDNAGPGTSVEDGTGGNAGEAEGSPAASPAPDGTPAPAASEDAVPAGPTQAPGTPRPGGGTGATTSTESTDAEGTDATDTGESTGAEATDSGSTGDGTAEDPSATGSPRPSPSPSASASLGAAAAEQDDLPPASSDTFFLVLGKTGALVSNPGNVALKDLPDQTAVAAATVSGDDWRTVTAGGIRIRLLTQSLTSSSGAVTGFLESGFVLTLHDEENSQLILTILAASLIGLLGAGVITLLVTRRALVPVRAAFATERRFVASASHELRTPVAVIRASAEIIQREDLVAAEGATLIEDVISESDRLARLVGDLLALASAEAGAISIDRQPLELRTFMADLGRRADAMARVRGVQIAVEDTGPDRDQPLTLKADRDRLTQLLLILIDNAVEHSPDGSTVRLRVRKVAGAHPPAAEVAVIDQGPGVPPNERERIFEPFARLAGRPRSDTGSGLGLAIARMLADKHGATLGVGDAPGGGAVFTLSFPLA